MEGRRKKIQAEKKRHCLSYGKLQRPSHFCALLFTFPVILFSLSFLETKTAREKSHRKYSDREKHQELGKLSGGTRQTRILNKRKAFIICQKFLYLLCLPTE